MEFSSIFELKSSCQGTPCTLLVSLVGREETQGFLQVRMYSSVMNGVYVWKTLDESKL